MKIIAITDKNYLLEATKEELSAIMNAVTGGIPKDILIGLKIPAIDYASTITKIKTLKTNYAYKELINRAEELNSSLKSLQEAVESASNVEI